jgi:hypothetical protein
VAGSGRLEIEKVALSGRPLQAQTLHERMIELLTLVSPPRIFTSLVPTKIVELMALGQGAEPRQTVGINQIVESFFSVLGFPRLDSEAVVRRAIRRGVKEGTFGYVGHSGQEEITRVNERGGYLINSQQVRIGVDLPEDEIDIGAAFIILPVAIAPEQVVTQPTPDPQPGGGAVTPTPGSTGTTQGGGAGHPGPERTAVTHIRLPLRMNRQQLYASFNAIANLAEQAGQIQVTVEAHKPDGFDPNWLRNAVYEPLEEENVQMDE